MLVIAIPEIAKSAFPDTPAGWLPYMCIEDFDESLSKVERNGGVVIEKSVTNYQWKGQRFGLIADPSGNRMMLCEAKLTN